MAGIYYTGAADWLRAIGLDVVEVDGWKTRARSSGGFPEPAGALGVQWHHTASSTTPENDTAYMFVNADDAPIGNMLLDRDGVVWLGAAGAANTAGKGGPLTLSRGTIPLDGANSRTWAIEAANNGVGEAWPAVQIDAYHAVSNELNRRFGNLPADVFNHHTWASTRKVDPATAGAVQGLWRPASSTSSGTWDQSDVVVELNRRAAGLPTDPDPDPDPEPPPIGETDMLYLARVKGTDPPQYHVGNGVIRNDVTAGQNSVQAQMDSGASKWHHAQRVGWPVITRLADVAEMTEPVLDALLGHRIDTP